MSETDALLAEISADEPCGSNLEYSSEFGELEQAAAGKPERQLGDRITPAEAPDWSEVKKQAELLLKRSKDLRIAVMLTRALTRVEHMPGLALGLKLIHSMLDRYWEGLHPRLDPDDGDATVRANTLSALADPELLLRDVRAAHIVAPGKHGRVSVREALIALGKLPASPEDAPSSLSRIESIIRAARAEDPTSIEALREASEAADLLVGSINDRLGSAAAPDLTNLTALLAALRPLCQSPLAAADPALAALNGAERLETGDIRSREDAIRLLNKVCEFVERTEPAHPAPLLIRRAQRLMTKNFVEIIQDLAPDSLNQIQKIAGLSEK